MALHCLENIWLFFTLISSNLSNELLYLYYISLLENSTAEITSTGSLVFNNFEENMTGVYTCFLEYKPTVEEPAKNLQLKYVIYGRECI